MGSAVLTKDAVNKQNMLEQIKKKHVNNPQLQLVGGCQDGYLQSAIEELNAELPRASPVHQLNQGSRIQIQHLNHSATTLSLGK